MAHKKHVDNEITERVQKKGVAINDALNQIHWRSMRSRGDFDGKGLPIASKWSGGTWMPKTYSQVVKDLNMQGKKEVEWKVVMYKKRPLSPAPKH